ncbi:MULTISPECIES: restriction endonuclease [unclassified Rhodococcus (in: high G+C Gram-positive bacteria)]|uniref:restriction endonuclease n=1 Tax=unclassified Rhodococcus (in: high G+C Gram-positive bacteria) TaxID=192944 RepID=UPI000B9BCB5B|nr:MULTISPECIES: restriction endonuclease [unclassified Rhodococcus (in: high G+C Gram-positive bacteria)]OZE36124.1 hypothetical protein CH259_13570 [Rhodococcus sp. 05-2254-4]OZE41237.1 hypothetical protein CH261_25045 [Rhodococcus sp. 05-2254-3]OZE44584.1 hypothetical protein CH283_27300 [Rhodococcus sp. 05-2254-2]
MAIHGKAENQMAREMRELGYNHASVSTDRSAYGVIVRAPKTMAQVRDHQAAAERADLTNLFLARGMEKDIDLIFFARGGYTEAAFEYAGHAGIALFTFDHKWQSKPVNFAAIEIYEQYAKRLAQKAAQLKARESRQHTERPTERGLLNLRIVGILVVLSILNLIGVAIFDIPAGFWIVFWIIALAYLRTTIESDD